MAYPKIVYPIGRLAVCVPARRALLLRCSSAYTSSKLTGGYYDVTPGTNGYAVNAHFWGAGNTYTNTWLSLGLFLRGIVEPNVQVTLLLNHVRVSFLRDTLNFICCPSLPLVLGWRWKSKD